MVLDHVGSGLRILNSFRVFRVFHGHLMFEKEFGDKVPRWPSTKAKLRISIALFLKQPSQFSRLFTDGRPADLQSFNGLFRRRLQQFSQPWRCDFQSISALYLSSA